MQRENCGGEEAKRNTPLNKRGNTACLSLSITVTNKQTDKQANKRIRSQELLDRKQAPSNYGYYRIEIEISLALEVIVRLLPGIAPVSREKAFYVPTLRNRF